MFTLNCNWLLLDKPGLGGTYREDDQRSGYKNYREREERKPKPVPPPQGPPQIISGFPPPGANVINAPFLDPNMMQQHQALPLPPSGIPPGSIIVDAMGNVLQGAMPGVGVMQPGLPRGTQRLALLTITNSHRWPGLAPHINPVFMPFGDAIPPIDPKTGLTLHNRRSQSSIYGFYMLLYHSCCKYCHPTRHDRQLMQESFKVVLKP